MTSDTVQDLVLQFYQHFDDRQAAAWDCLPAGTQAVIQRNSSSNRQIKVGLSGWTFQASDKV